MLCNLFKKNWGTLSTLGACLVVLISASPVDIGPTILLLIAVSFIGIWQIRKLTAVCNDANLSALEYFWLIKLLLSMVLVAVVWAPEIYGAGDLLLTYDPIRYFYQSLALVKNDWRFNGGINSSGILYYYGIIFFIFGHNPFIAALANILVTLSVTTIAIYWMYGFLQKVSDKKYTLIYLILIPDFLWFDCLTSRESIAAWLILLIIITSGELFYRKHLPIKKIIILSVCILAVSLLFLLRSTMLLPIALLLIITILFMPLPKALTVLTKVIIILIIFAFLGLRPMMLAKTGSLSLGWVETLNTLTHADRNVPASTAAWSDRSIGKLLTPTSIDKAIFFVPIRMFVYLVAPLPNIPISDQMLKTNNYGLWQNGLSVITGLLCIILFPLSLVSFIYSLKTRYEHPLQLHIQLAFWLVWATIAGGNLIIQERYRVMMLPLFFITVWLGYINSDKKTISTAYKVWAALLLIGLVFLYLYRTY
jgi:hypothetical protein